jgi:hypothetical protein
MTAADFRRIALSLEGVEEYAHAGLPAFRVGGRKFASLASQAGGYGNLMLTLEQHAAFVEEAPEMFLPIPGGWGKMGHTYSPGGGEPGCIDGRTPNRVETENREERKDKRKKAPFVAAMRRSR